MVSAPNAVCAAIADQRAQDAADNGFSREIQQAIRNHVYSDCLTAPNRVVVVPRNR